MLAFSLLLLAGDVARAVGGGLSLLCVLHVPATRHQHLRLSLCCLTITSYCFCQNTKDVHALLCLEQRDRLASCGSLWYRYTTKVKRPELNWNCVSFQSRNEWHRTKALDLFALFCFAYFNFLPGNKILLNPYLTTVLVISKERPGYSFI